MMGINQQLYGNYRNRTFNDIWNTVESFQSDYNDFSQGLIDNTISETAQVTLFYLLSAQYGNSTVASANEYQFKMKVFSTIFMYGPNWEKRLEIQKAIRNLTIEEVERGGKAIYNSALNPSRPVSGGDNGAVDASEGEGTNTLLELTYINQQNTTNYKKSKPEAYAIWYDLLKTDVTNEFLTKFKKLFLKVVSPELPLWYVSDKEDVIDDN